jgi:hypothetical protein
MTWASVDDMKNAVSEIVSNGRKVCYASCCSDLQTQEQHRQHNLHQQLNSYRLEAIASQNEEVANAAFLMQEIVSCLLHSLQMWLLIKNEEMTDAWNELVEAQDSLQLVLRFIQTEEIQDWYMRLLALEKLLFPPQQFVSISHSFGRAQCNICMAVYGDCDHVAGQLYMGQLCVKQLRDCGPMRHIAIVDSPRDKGCRWTEIKLDGFTQCTLTLRLRACADGEQPNFRGCVLRSR